MCCYTGLIHINCFLIKTIMIAIEHGFALKYSHTCNEYVHLTVYPGEVLT
jgi:hypothetical protein